MSSRQELIDYVRSRYGSEIEYLWMRYPSYGVFRHPDNQKWYAIIMDIPRNRLGLSGEEIVDVVKTMDSRYVMSDEDVR